jgi:hypothetical protein
MKTIYIFLFFCLCSIHLKAQLQHTRKNSYQLLSISCKGNFLFKTDSLNTSKLDSLNQLKKPSKHNPKLATIMSAVLPGAGQVYNRKYWKTPIIWAGIGACGYFIRSNHLFYKDYKDALIQRNDTSIKEPDKYFEIYSTDQLITLQDQYRQNRDLLIIAASLVYVLNIVDALVDAHLFSFDVSDDLSFNWQPYYQYGVYTSNTVGLNLQLKLR